LELTNLTNNTLFENKKGIKKDLPSLSRQVSGTGVEPWVHTVRYILKRHTLLQTKLLAHFRNHQALACNKGFFRFTRMDLSGNS